LLAELVRDGAKIVREALLYEADEASEDQVGECECEDRNLKHLISHTSLISRS